MVPNKLSIDDLLDNLRVFGQGGGIEAETDRQAAELIVSQQAEIRDLAMEVLAATGQAQEAYAKIDTLTVEYKNHSKHDYDLIERLKGERDELSFELTEAEKTITNTARLRLDLEIERDRLKGMLRKLLIRANLMHDRLLNPPEGGWVSSGTMDGHLDAINQAQALLKESESANA